MTTPEEEVTSTLAEDVMQDSPLEPPKQTAPSE